MLTRITGIKYHFVIQENTNRAWLSWTYVQVIILYFFSQDQCSSIYLTLYWQKCFRILIKENKHIYKDTSEYLII